MQASNGRAAAPGCNSGCNASRHVGRMSSRGIDLLAMIRTGRPSEPGGGTDDVSVRRPWFQHRGVRPPTINGAVAALRFFFSVTLDRPDLARHLTLDPRDRLVDRLLGADAVGGDAMDGLLPDPLVVDAAVAPNVAVYGFVPQWFHTAKLRLQIMPEDEAGARP